MTGLRGRAGVAGAALILLAGLVVALATALPGPTVTTATQGVDVSSHEHPQNAVINWPEVAAAGYTFTAIKASEATYYVNPYYASDAVQAARAGLFVMPYAFANPFRAKDNGSAKEQADAAVRQLNSAAVPASQMLPLALDVEPDPDAASQKTSQCYGLSHAAMVTWIRQFLDEAQLKTGMKPVIYTTANWWNACTGNSATFGGYPLWIASYGKSAPALPAGWDKYTFWQHTAKSAVRGITGSSTDEDFLGPVDHASPAARPVSFVRYPPPAPAGFTYWIAAALLVVSAGIAALAGLTTGFRDDALRRARTDGVRNAALLRQYPPRSGRHAAGKPAQCRLVDDRPETGRISRVSMLCLEAMPISHR